jgi:hypothetical protein
VVIGPSRNPKSSGVIVVGVADFVLLFDFVGVFVSDIDNEADLVGVPVSVYDCVFVSDSDLLSL